MPFRIDIDKTRLTCKLSWDPSVEQSKSPDRKDIADLLESKKIKGVDPFIIDQAFGDFIKQGKLKDFVLKKGQPPTPSKDGVVNWLFDPDADKIHAGKMSKEGSIDYRERRSFVEVAEDQLIGTWTPPTIGNPGQDVFGEIVPPAQPRQNEIKVGKNVRLSDDGTKCYSTIKGHVLASGFKVSVDMVYRINGDVDFNTGNIHYPGNVEVGGSVREGFVIEAKGDIFISGLVESAEVRATGNIIVNRGVIRNSRVIAEGSVDVEFVQDSYVESGSKITVKKSIVKSRLNAKEDILLADMYGANGIVGGKVRAGFNVTTYCIGSPMGVVTKVGAGTNTKLFFRYRQLVSLGLKAKKNVTRYEKFLKLIEEKEKQKGSKLESKNREKLEKALSQQKNELDKVLTELKEIKKEAEQSTSAKVDVFGTAHEGSEISIWGIYANLTESVDRSRFFFDDSENKVTCKPIKF